ncbi:RICIN domain-containing protein [Actinoplanes sp. CA-030573]|uniref:RICIN domain-containing protein n=1 Tax=Actinoplanes sp. CA-030573 TaxID=3239898 RepID=UPI003D8CC8AD
MLRKRLLHAVIALVTVTAGVVAGQSPASATVTFGPYMYEGEQSHKCIDVPHANPANNVVVTIYTCQYPQVSNQQWWERESEPGYFHIFTLYGAVEKCLAVQNASTADNAAILQFDCNSGDNEEWYVNHRSGQTAYYYEIKNHKSGKCLTVKNNGTANGSTLLQFTCNGGKNQSWFW